VNRSADVKTTVAGKEPDQKPIPLTTLDNVLKFIQEKGDLPRAACTIGNDIVMLFKWKRGDGILSITGRIIEPQTIKSVHTRKKTKKSS
jgi:hypothetical protein